MTPARLTMVDARGVRHEVAHAHCGCGCMLLYAVDDPRVVWHPGDWESEDQVDMRCTDRRCRCHVWPARGEVLEGEPVPA